MLPEVKKMIELYGLAPLPVEGTLYTQTYRSQQTTANGGPLGTAIIALYCEEPYSVSLFHRLSVDEVWHFYAGDPLRLVLLYPDGSSREVIMGNDFEAGQAVQFVVPAGVWQAGHMLAGGRYSLYGCTMAPGFNSSIFEGGSRSQLLAAYPQRAEDIRRLCCADGVTCMPTDFNG